jgi:hypothetical protein
LGPARAEGTRLVPPFVELVGHPDQAQVTQIQGYGVRRNFLERRYVWVDEQMIGDIERGGGVESPLLGALRLEVMRHGGDHALR